MDSTTSLVKPNRPKLAMDTITFFNAPLWGKNHFTELWKPGAVPPEVFWDKALDIVARSGIRGMEIVGGMSSFSSAIERFGSAEGFSGALADHGLEMSSGFFTGALYDGDHNWDSTGVKWRTKERQEELFREVDEYSRFIKAAGADTLVMGLPMRKSWNSPEPRFVDLQYMAELAELYHRLGYIIQMNGVKFAVHTETRSTFWLRRDIDLFLSLTDPVYVNFCPDTAHITLGGANPVDVLRDHSERVIMTHWKDAKGSVTPHVVIDDNIEAALHPMFARVGTGVIDWHAWATAVKEAGYEGWAVIELDAAEDPLRDLTEAREHIDAVLDDVYGTE